MAEKRKERCGLYQGAMIRRVGIAQAMLNDPRILVLDEPTAGLDPNERIRFRNLISELSEDRLVLLSTHIVSDVEYVANDIRRWPCVQRYKHWFNERRYQRNRL